VTPKKRILVVGGTKSFVFGNLARNMALCHLTVEWHVADTDGESVPFTSLPDGCAGAVCLRDMTSRSTFWAVAQACKDGNVPFAAVPRVWKVAEGIMRVEGILGPAEGGGKAAPPEDVREVALAYLVTERHKGRMPKRDEVNGAAQRAFGTKVSLPAKTFRELHTVAALAVPDLETMGLDIPALVRKELTGLLAPLVERMAAIEERLDGGSLTKGVPDLRTLEALLARANGAELRLTFGEVSPPTDP